MRSQRPADNLPTRCELNDLSWDAQPSCISSIAKAPISGVLAGRLG
jgi:hypothetical protein